MTLGVGPCRIAGVAGDVREGPLAEQIRPAMYPLFSSRFARRTTYLLTREYGNIGEPAAHLREAIRRVDPTVSVLVAPLSERMRAQTATLRLGATILVGLGGFALAVASLGIAATIAQVSAERRRELAIRYALGARTRSVVGFVVRVGAVPAIAGIAIGLVACWWVSPLLRPLLFQTKVFTPGLWAVGAALILIITSLACWLPARHVRSIDIVSALRRE